MHNHDHTRVFCSFGGYAVRLQNSICDYVSPQEPNNTRRIKNVQDTDTYMYLHVSSTN